MALVKPYIFQIVGYKNSGKTTFMNELLCQLTKRGMKVVTIKHHGHGGKPAIVDDTDSAQHIHAGASASLVEGGGRLVLQVEDIEWSLQQKIDFLSYVSPEIILIEGHKNENYEKVVFIRDKNDFHLLSELKNIAMVIFHDDIDQDFPYKSFQRNNPQAIPWIVDYLEKQQKNNH